jgi:hypothetical protein
MPHIDQSSWRKYRTASDFPSISDPDILNLGPEPGLAQSDPMRFWIQIKGFFMTKIWYHKTPYVSFHIPKNRRSGLMRGLQPALWKALETWIPTYFWPFWIPCWPAWIRIQSNTNYNLKETEETRVLGVSGRSHRLGDLGRNSSAVQVKLGGIDN